MNEKPRKVLVGVLAVLSVLCAIGFACMVGTILHGGHQAIVSGPDTAAMPSASGWVVTVLLGLGTLLGGRWAAWLATLAKVVPVVTTVIEGNAKDRTEPPPEMPQRAVNSHEALLSALLTTLEITSGRSCSSSGKHTLGGGEISWAVEFKPGEAKPAK